MDLDYIAAIAFCLILLIFIVSAGLTLYFAIMGMP